MVNETRRPKMEAAKGERITARDVLGEALKESAGLLGLAVIFVAYTLLLVAVGDDIARALTPMFHPAVGR
jgi:hypothetical protein